MKLRNWLLRRLAEKELIEWKPDYYNQKEREIYDEQREEIRKLEAGEEVAPPWRGAPSWNNPARLVGNSFNDKIWETFWESLDDEGKRNYLRKHQPSPEDWYQVFVKAWTLGEEKESDWLERQKKRMRSGEEIEPPWTVFSISLPETGWDDYFLESWKIGIWIPFWDGLSQAEQRAYLEKWRPPNDEWRKNILVNWTGKIRKTDGWLERQKMFLERKDDFYKEPLNLPRYVFPRIASTKTFWDENFIDEWLKEIWVPYWNGLSDEQQDEELKYIKNTDEDELKRLARHRVKNMHKFKN